VSLDTFPYSGTTTSCESLIMGTPVFTTRGKHHVQNVTCSILENISPEFKYFIYTTPNDLIDKVSKLEQDRTKLLSKEYVRKTFLDSKVCNGTEYVNDFWNVLSNIIKY
jgi:predicted O-linked N-acetylglucosamine transferase (SPINDLY family)